MSLKDLLDNSKDKSLSEQKWHMLRQFITKRLLTGGNATIAELSAEIQSSVPTVTKAVNELLAEGYVVDMVKLQTAAEGDLHCLALIQLVLIFLGLK